MHGKHLDEQAYRSAEQLLGHHRRELVLGDRVAPRWLGDGARFWYTVRTPAGRRFVLVDPALGTRCEAFDHPRLAAALGAAAEQEDLDPGALPLSGLKVDGDAVVFDAFGRRWSCTLAHYRVEPVPGPVPGSPLEVRSPDGRHAVYRAGHDLRARATDGSKDWALTADGTQDADFGANPDYLMYSTLLAKLGLPHLPPAVAWSPDGTRVLTHRTDQHRVRRTHLHPTTPADGGGGPGALLSPRFAVPGDEHLPQAQFTVLDLATGAATTAAAAPVEMSLMSPIFQKWAWWEQDGSAVYYLRRSRDARTLGLERMDAASGQVRTLLTESAPTRVEPGQRQLQQPLVQVLDGGRQVLWYSQRDGWGHLYLFDAGTGDLLTQVTSGPWAVQEILHVDQEAGVVYFTASGLVQQDPYRRTVCRAKLDGSGWSPVLQDDLDHVVSVPPGGGYFVDAASTTELAPVTCVRDWSGRVLVELERADTSALQRTGWSAPQRFRTTSADGSCEIFGLLYRPHGFDPARRYPVLDTPYGLPTDTRVSPAFDPGHYGYEAEALAALGFVVLAIDGQGSPGRSKAFHDVSYGNLGEACGLVDHVAAIRQLAATRPWMDLERVGVSGMSSGGYAAVRALLRYPEVFKVGVAASGMHDFRLLEAGLGEAYHGPYDAGAYAQLSNTEAAAALRGALLLVHGGLDDRVPPQATLRLAQALAEHGKDFDLVLVPEAEHLYFGYEHYVTQRRWDFLVRHLLGAEPPAGYRLPPVPVDLEALAELFG